MSEFKGSARPWEIKKSPFEVYNTDHGALTHQVNSGQTMLAALYVHHESHDARLIAAAPDLLEALSTLLNMDVKGHRLGDRLQFSTPGRKILDKCNSAIAKALGEDQ